LRYGARVGLEYYEALMQPGDLPDIADLVALLVTRPAWHAEAACRGRGTAAWFPAKGHTAEAGRALRSGCPVASECHAYALDYGEELRGVWAGTTHQERRRLRRTAA
jgi:hypothetical protein